MCDLKRRGIHSTDSNRAFVTCHPTPHISVPHDLPQLRALLSDDKVRDERCGFCDEHIRVSFFLTLHRYSGSLEPEVLRRFLG